MRHISCDLCGKWLDPDLDRRFIVKVEIAPAYEADAETEFDVDPLDDLKMEIEYAEAGRPDDEPPEHHINRYDLCQACHQVYAADPIRGGRKKKLRFSEN